ncbi:hypothetical protein ATPR_0212 [Acetobacter tropicalis NBRC 101654]|uniref:Uncharacterized protein n=1 Tax=Acetobacter tropicalis NBRC 101654 TaxID=749388 RepID=F7VA14_9PROT|nr:hypothetical protein ATPR_0212 [Acetobacter tropicalis NBRC 101654]
MAQGPPTGLWRVKPAFSSQLFLLAGQIYLLPANWLKTGPSGFQRLPAPFSSGVPSLLRGPPWPECFC